MSDKDLIPLENVQLPDYLRGFESELSSSMVTQAESWPRISLRGKQFRFKKDGVENSLSMGQPLKIVILLADPLKGCAKSYYADAYSSGSDDAPDCSSANGIMPDSFSDDAQCSTCAACAHSEWGSAVDSNGNPSKGKACNDVKRLFVAAPNNPAGDIFLLQVPPASLKALSTYGRNLAKHGIPVEGVVTVVQFIDSEFPQIDFNFDSFLPETQAKIAIDRSKSEEILSISNQSAPALAAPVVEPEPDPIKEQQQQARDVEEGTGFDGFGGTTELDGLDQDLELTSTTEPDPNLTVALSPAQVKKAVLLAQLAELEEGGEGAAVELDDADEPWNAEKHAANHAKTGKGLWAKLRGAGKKADPTPKTEVPAKDNSFFDEPQTEIPPDAGGSGDLSSILDEWGS